MSQFDFTERQSQDYMAPPAKRTKTTTMTKSRRTPRVPRPIGSGIQQNYRTKLRYAYEGVLPCTNYASVVFRAGSCFDPEFAVGGHQPYYYDQLAALYQHYIVHKSKITVTACGTGAAITRVDSPTTLVLFGDDSGSAAFVGKQTILERPGCKAALFPAFDVGNSVTKKLTMTYDKDKVFKNYKNSELQALTTANPAEDYYFIVAGWNTNGPTSSGIWLQIAIEYDVEFFEVKEVSGS